MRRLTFPPYTVLYCLMSDCVQAALTPRYMNTPACNANQGTSPNVRRGDSPRLVEGNAALDKELENEVLLIQ